MRRLNTNKVIIVMVGNLRLIPRTCTRGRKRTDSHKLSLIVTYAMTSVTSH